MPGLYEPSCQYFKIVLIWYFVSVKLAHWHSPTQLPVGSISILGQTSPHNPSHPTMKLCVVEPSTLEILQAANICAQYRADIKQAGAELCQAQFKLGLAKPI